MEAYKKTYFKTEIDKKQSKKVTEEKHADIEQEVLQKIAEMKEIKQKGD